MEFFTPLSMYLLVTTLLSSTHFHKLPIIPISTEEIAKAAFYISSLKGVGPNDIPANVGQKFWAIIQDKIVHLFMALVHLDILSE